MKSELTGWLHAQTNDPEILHWTSDLLQTLCAVDTSISSDLENLRSSEERCFNICQNYLDPANTATMRKLPVDGTAIKEDMDYTIPYYAGPLRESPEKVYHGRSNLVISNCPNNTGRRWILNAHMDTVAPYIPPKMHESSLVYGRGTADNKGGVTVAMLVWRLLHKAAALGIVSTIPTLDLLFVIDEEAGGNGSLSAIRHLQADSKSPVIVLEPTNLIPYPANRGALWFSLELTAKSESSRDVLLLAASQMITAIVEAGKDIKTSSKHALFSENDVQTCFGILGSHGHHPSSACTYVDIRTHCPQNSSLAENLPQLVRSSFKKAVDSGKIIHHTNDPVVEPVCEGSAERTIRFTSEGGHMGSRTRDDDAILKAASTIMDMHLKIQQAFYFPDRPQTLHLEGGQGFLPDFSIQAVKDRIKQAAEAGLQNFCAFSGFSGKDFHYTLTFNKLHNRAYCSDNSRAAPLLAEAASEFAGKPPAELKGWQASCDARIFARKFKDVVTFGAGRLENAHQENEHVDVSELLQAAAAIAYAISVSEGKRP
ncbi:MAG: M20/M25/M40 family metallo-hydrolase [Desulfobacterales bacterium]